ncbi:hypothetical protein, partial [Klebsiella aerogenes]|uniref:hypothetical protein n=1 Tax=Klebsiella aerogenes TaxID=548 RepID=UPI001954F5B2
YEESSIALATGSVETVIPSDTKLKPIEPHPTINKKATVGNDETILDTYSIKIDEIEMELLE